MLPPLRGIRAAAPLVLLIAVLTAPCSERSGGIPRVASAHALAQPDAAAAPQPVPFAHSSTAASPPHAVAQSDAQPNADAAAAAQRRPRRGRVPAVRVPELGADERPAHLQCAARQPGA